LASRIDLLRRIPDAFRLKLTRLNAVAPEGRTTERFASSGTAETAKAELLRAPAASTPEIYKMVCDPSFDIFYGAPLLVVICATSQSLRRRRTAVLPPRI
jgi:hypothetical protein